MSDWVEGKFDASLHRLILDSGLVEMKMDLSPTDRSRAPRGNASRDAPRHN